MKLVSIVPHLISLPSFSLTRTGATSDTRDTEISEIPHPSLSSISKVRVRHLRIKRDK